MKFLLALWGSKLLLFIYKLLGNEKDDKPGILALKICDKFLKKIKKTSLVVGVTGTNGKTTVVNLVANALENNGYKVIYNDWGANTKAGLARCLIEGVNIFNRKRNVVAVLEIDEVSSNVVLPQVNLDYLIVTNLFRDSMHRNAHSEYVFDKLYEGIGNNTKLILNADDILSSGLGDKYNNAIYYSIERQDSDKKNSNNIINDFKICPECNSNLIYEYNRYHHIGKLHCSKCDFKSKNADYNAKVNLMDGNLKLDGEEYKLLNNTIFNAYNLLAVICFLKSLNKDDKTIKKCLENIRIVKSRYSSTIVNDISVETLVTKGLNAVAVSRVFDHISSLSGNIEIILVVDDIFDNKNGSEAIAWIYDTDFEFLNKPNIKRIVVGGVRSKDYKLRMLFAGIDESKIFICDDEYDTVDYLDYNNVDKILILHEVYFITGGMKIKDEVVAKIKGGNK